MKTLIFILVILTIASCNSTGTNELSNYKISFSRLKGDKCLSTVLYKNELSFIDTFQWNNLNFPSFLASQEFDNYWTCGIIDSLINTDFTSGEFVIFERIINRIVEDSGYVLDLNELDKFYKNTFYNSTSSLDKDWKQDINSFYNELNRNSKYDTCEKVMYNKLHKLLISTIQDGIYFTKKIEVNAKVPSSKQFVLMTIADNKINVRELCPNIRNYDFE